MVLRKTSTLKPATIERLKFLPPFNACKGSGWFSIRLINSVAGNIRECVPETIESIETLQYLGLTMKAASHCFPLITDIYRADEEEDGLEFIEYAILYVKMFPDCSKDDTVSKWEAAMKEMGMQDWWIKAILDPRYAKLRQEHTALYWIQQTMEDKWNKLITLNERIESVLLVVEEAKPMVEDVKPMVEDMELIVEDVKPIVEDVKPIVEDTNSMVEAMKHLLEQ